MLKKKRACALFLLEPVGVRLALGFGLNDLILHLIEKDVLHLLVGEVLRQTVRRGGEDFLRGHVGGDGITQDGENLRHQGSTRIGTLRLSLGLGFVAGLALLGKLLDHAGDDFTRLAFISGNKVQSNSQSVLLSHSKSLSGL